MRRLGRVRAVVQPAVLALVSVAALTSCAGSGAGVRLEGSPTASRTPQADASVVTGGRSGEPGDGGGSPSTGPGGRHGETTPSPVPGSTRVYSEDGSTDVIALLRSDPKVSRNVKRDLKPCTGKLWPVSVAYGHATGGPRVDLVVNVTSCADKVGVGTYVYRRSTSGTLVNVFSAERPPVHAEFDGGRLVVTREVFIGNEPMCCPSGRDRLTYAWDAGVFREVARKRTDTASEAPGAGDGGKD